MGLLEDDIEAVMGEVERTKQVLTKHPSYRLIDIESAHIEYWLKRCGENPDKVSEFKVHIYEYLRSIEVVIEGVINDLSKIGVHI